MVLSSMKGETITSGLCNHRLSSTNDKGLSRCYFLQRIEAVDNKARRLLIVKSWASTSAQISNHVHLVAYSVVLLHKDGFFLNRFVMHTNLTCLFPFGDLSKTN
eukprot:Platyproteum_vivax@DN13406_c0_g1_i1.p1